MNRNKGMIVLFILFIALLGIQNAQTLPQYLDAYNTTFNTNAGCGICHINPAGGGPRNTYGMLFGNQINHVTNPTAALVIIGQAPISSDILYPGYILNINQYIKSQDGRFTLIMQGDGNLVLYDSSWQPLWATGTDGKPVLYAIMQGDGNLVLYGSNYKPYWDSKTWGHPGAWLILQNDRNVVVYDSSWKPLWASGTEISDRLNPGESLPIGKSIFSQNMKFRLIMQGDGNLVLYDSSWKPLWATGTNGQTVSLAVMQNDGNFVLYGPKGKPLWNTNTWGHPGAWLKLEDSGYIAIYDSNGLKLWAIGSSCDPSYPNVCIPPKPPDLNCADIPYKNFIVLPPDPHGFDADKDGIGCET